MNKTVATILAVIIFSGIVATLQQWWFPNENSLSGWALFNSLSGAFLMFLFKTIDEHYDK